MTTQCEFCDKPDEKNHLLECEMVVGFLFDGDTALSFPEETSIQLVNTVKKPKRIPSTRWKNMRELCDALRGVSTHSNTMMYA